MRPSEIKRSFWQRPNDVGFEDGSLPIPRVKVIQHIHVNMQAKFAMDT